EVLAYGGPCTIANAIQYPSSTNNLVLEIGGANNLTFTGPFTLNGNDAYYPPAYVNRTVQVTNTALTTFSGVISDQTNGASAGYALTITGNGTNFVGPLILTAINTYSGPTTNAGAVLLVNGSVGPGEVVVSTNGTLGGTGIITGPVIVQSNATLTAGTQLTPGVQSIGTLTISNSLTFLPGSISSIQVTSSTHDLINVSNAVTYAGTLIANNISGTLSLGDSFQIFNVQGTKSGTFSTITGTPGPGLAWSFNSTSGVLSVIAGNAPFTISPGVTNITLSGSNVILSGTNAQSGAIYYLLTSTNLLVPVKDWLPVSTNIASGANAFTFTATNAITAHDAQQFYIFSNTNN
ncbi:MAG TPA: hypothetical protein VK811_01930, partial [Candidatus Acidoferrum sp.]|nr:hypothetical protein [Candidatus Acidoferrum sp.]